MPSIVLDDEALYYILEHEIAHYYHGDLLFKFLMEAGKAVWWWNPLLYFVKSQISVLMEINADTKVTEKLDDYGKISYLQCLLKMAKFQGKGRKKEFKQRSKEEILLPSGICTNKFGHTNPQVFFHN